MNERVIPWPYSSYGEAFDRAQSIELGNTSLGDMNGVKVEVVSEEEVPQPGLAAILA
jgi:hypothetical protein